MGQSTGRSVNRRWRCRAVSCLVLALPLISGCGLKIDGAYAIKATVSGLVGTGLELEMNGHDPVTVTSDGEVILAYMVTGYHYSVTVKTQPSNPTQTCAVTNATGVMGTADVANISVSCSVNAYLVKGTVTGLQGSGLKLKLNDQEILPVSGATFEFQTKIANGAPYTVTVDTQPTNPYQICSVSGSGTMGDSDVTNVAVTCSTTAQAPPDSLVYSFNPAVYVTGTPIAANAPSNGGGAIASYSVSPALPSGLSLNTSTGLISGTPTAASPTASFIVTGTNPLGSTTASLSITVHSPPTIFAQPADQSVYVGMSATFGVIASSTAPLSYQWHRNGTPISGATSASYSTPTVSSSDNGYSYSVTIGGCCGISIASNVAALTVKTWSGFTYTGSLGTKRFGHTATLLNDGTILIAGGYDWSASPWGSLLSVELFDPARMAFSPARDLSVQRSQHTATLLANGKVLIAGGCRGSGPLSTAELYDPATGYFSATGDLNVARCAHTATMLANGKILFVGGVANDVSLDSAELYDPETGRFTTITERLHTARNAHTATMLANGKVLFAGGYGNNPPYVLSSAEVFDPAKLAFATTGNMLAARSSFASTLLANGRVLVTGEAIAELYDPDTGIFSKTGAPITSRDSHTSTLLPDGKVLIAGGYGYPTSAEIYDPASGSFSETGSLGEGRRYHTATLLRDGRVLLAGGDRGGTVLSSAQVYQ